MFRNKIACGLEWWTRNSVSISSSVDEAGNVVDIQREDNIIYLPVSYTVTAGAFGDGSIKYDSIELPE